jgi:hypothetical protein
MGKNTIYHTMLSCAVQLQPHLIDLSHPSFSTTIKLRAGLVQLMPPRLITCPREYRESVWLRSFLFNDPCIAPALIPVYQKLKVCGFQCAVTPAHCSSGLPTADACYLGNIWHFLPTLGSTRDPKAHSARRGSTHCLRELET